MRFDGQVSLTRQDDMQNLLVVGLGGFVGAVTRYQIGTLMAGKSLALHFPIATLLVNISGCFLMGVLATILERRQLLGGEIQLLLLTGLLGGYTTFSAFGFETVQLIKRQDFGLAGLYVILSVVGGIAALWLGIWVAKIQVPPSL